MTAAVKEFVPQASKCSQQKHMKSRHRVCDCNRAVWGRKFPRGMERFDLLDSHFRGNDRIVITPFLPSYLQRDIIAFRGMANRNGKLRMQKAVSCSGCKNCCISCQCKDEIDPYNFHHPHFRHTRKPYCMCYSHYSSLSVKKLPAFLKY